MHTNGGWISKADTPVTMPWIINSHRDTKFREMVVPSLLLQNNVPTVLIVDKPSVQVKLSVQSSNSLEN